VKTDANAGGVFLFILPVYMGIKKTKTQAFKNRSILKRFLYQSPLGPKIRTGLQGYRIQNLPRGAGQEEKKRQHDHKDDSGPHGSII
jgi:hypothetical protein